MDNSDFIGGGMARPPVKPARGNKNIIIPGGSGSHIHGPHKETGILMRVIKTLSMAASTDHRDREKTKLEKDFKKSDAQLDALLATRQPSLSSVMQVGL
jgi:exocyst complex component 4